jgi:hypothetical protein
MLLLLSLGGVETLAQFSSGAQATAKDISVAVVPGAKITLTNAQLAVSKATTTNQGGHLRIDIVAATYSLEIQTAGFKTPDQKKFTLQVEMKTINPLLEIRSISADLTVSASAAPPQHGISYRQSGYSRTGCATSSRPEHLHRS